MLRQTMCKILLCVGLVCGMLHMNAYAAEMNIQNIDLTGLDAALRANKGKVVVINFFATWCPPCREEIPGLVQLRKNLPNDDVTILGISVDEEKSPVNGFAKKMRINYPVYWAKGDVPSRYNVRTIPHNVIYDTTGKIAANVTGFVSEEDLQEFIKTLLEQK